MRKGQVLRYGDHMSEQVQHNPTQADHECFWLPFIVAMNEVFPRYDSLLCMNEHGDLAFVIIPEILVSMTIARMVHQQPNTDVAVIQRISPARDRSYLAPIIYTDRLSSRINDLVSSYGLGEMMQQLKSEEWPNLVRETRRNSLAHFPQPCVLQVLERANVVGRSNLTKPDDLNRWGRNEYPVFMYTSPENELIFERERFSRLFAFRRVMYESEEFLKYIADEDATGPFKKARSDDRKLIETIARVEFELELNSRVAKPEWRALVLDPEKAEVATEPEVTIRFTPKGQEALEKLQGPPKSYFSITDWGEPNIAQIVSHVGDQTAGAITIIKDELGIHTLPTCLFRVSAHSFDLRSTSQDYVMLDELPAWQIPEITWEPLTVSVTPAWWQTDKMTRKILWLAVQYLMSHEEGEPDQAICSVIPMGDNALQVAIAEGNRETGAPYAFAVIADDLEINAIPIFPSATSGGGRFLKNYTITRQGERLKALDMPELAKGPFCQLQATPRALLSMKTSADEPYTFTMTCARPIYSSILRYYPFDPSPMLGVGSFQLGQ